MKVPFYDMRAVPQGIRQQWLAKWEEVVESGVFIGGPVVREFEEAWSTTQLDGMPTVGVGNGLDAITIALKALGIGPENRVAVPAHTFIATWLAILAVGAQPVGVDVDARGQIDFGLLKAVEPIPDAVVVVHMHGMSPQMAPIVQWCAENEVLLVEDCAQAHGSVQDGRKVGTWGDASAFSFYPTKNLGATGDAGIAAFRAEEPAEIARSIRNYGSSTLSKYKHERLGVNSRLDPLQAASLLVSIDYLSTWNERRRQIAAAYLEALGEHPRIRPLCTSVDESVWHHFVVLTEQRSRTRHVLDKAGVGSDVHYPYTAAGEVGLLCQTAPIHRLEEFVVSNDISQQALSVPMHPWLSQEQVGFVSRALTSVERQA